jgi:hypothetical protein
VTDFATAIERLHNRVRHWEQPRWSAPVASGTRGDLTYALVQHLADLAADAESRPRRAVPREPDMILPDQLRVMSDDLLAAAPSPSLLTEAATAVNAVRESL